MDCVTSKCAFVDYPCVNLRGGVPGVTRLKNCPELLLEATQAVLGGDGEFRQQLSKFLTEQYGDNVEKECVMMTAGATHGLQMALTLLISPSSPVFVIDPSYFLGHCIIQDDLHHTVIAVPSDSDGPLMDKFESLIKTHQASSTENNNSDDSTTNNDERPYNGAVYLIPTFNNPRATSYTPERCRSLVTLARKYNLLLLSDDVYNLIYFTEKEDQPKRLLTYDLPSDPNYGKGHVLSNGSFSKMLAPAVRLGWIEGPKDIVKIISDSKVAKSSGAFNHYVGKLVTELLSSGRFQQHLDCLRDDYKEAMKVLCDELDEGMPQGFSYNKPEGGFFLWLPLHPDVSGMELLEQCENKYKVTFVPGIKSSPSKGYKHHVRLGAAFVDKATLKVSAAKICRAYNELLVLKGIK